MQRIFPILGSFKNYSKSLFKHDLSAGLTVGVMLIPQGMAYAMIAGLPPQYGLYTAIFPTILYAIFGTSRQLSVGPVAMDSLLVAAGVGSIAAVGTDNYIALVILLALMIGVIQVSMGILRLGFIVNFLSKPVIHGFTFAAAVIISINQFKHLFGIGIGGTKHLHEQVALLISRIGETNLVTLLLSVTGVAILVAIKKFIPKVPGSLFVVVLGIFFTYFFSLDQYGVSIVGSIPDGLPSFEIPEINQLEMKSLLTIAITLSLIGFMEAYSIGQGLQSKHKEEYDIRANCELIGLGLGNVIGSFFSSIPATGGFSRSAVNEAAGAKTGLASLISASVVIMTLLFLTPLFYFLPNAILGAVIFVAVLGLIDVGEIKFLWKSDRYDFFMLAVSFIGTVVFGIEIGIGLGILLSLLVLIYKASNPHMAVLGRVEGTKYYRNLNRFSNAIDDPEVSILRFDGRIFFANVASLKSKFEQLVSAKPKINKFILDAQSISDIDSGGLFALADIITSCEEQNISFHMVSIIGPVRDKLFNSGLTERIRLSNIHECIDDALEGHSGISFQTNV